MNTMYKVSESIYIIMVIIIIIALVQLCGAELEACLILYFRKALNLRYSM